MNGNKKRYTIMAWLAAVTLLLAGCRFSGVHSSPDVPVVRVYDVEAQDREDVQYNRHLVRVGLMNCVGNMYEQAKGPYYDLIEALRYDSGIDFEYVVLGTWKELRQEMERTRGDGSTKIILFNNSYDESLIRELTLGGYADLYSVLDENGIYDDDVYEQTVLEAGKIGSLQLAIPLLYNVPSMIGAEETWEPTETDYRTIIEMIEQKMPSEEPYGQMAQMSAMYLDGAEPDLMLPAAGEPWEEYKTQKELFELLLQYVSDFIEYEVDPVSLQGQWAEWLKKDLDNGNQMCLDDNDQKILNLEGESSHPQMSILSQSAYITECSQAESVAFHSSWGMMCFGQHINGRMFFSETLAGQAGKRTMGYWPIRMLNGDGYAAQPVCMASVMDDGDPEVAFQVIKAFMDRPVAMHFGFSLKRDIVESQIDRWNDLVDGMVSFSKRMVIVNRNENKLEEGMIMADVETVRFSTEERELYGNILLQQLNDVAFAQLCDREIETIWQETLLESVQEGLSAEAGFERLCDRMDAYWAEFE